VRWTKSYEGLELSDDGRPVTVERPGGTFEQVPGK
jgi:hypothetical protein